MTLDWIGWIATAVFVFSYRCRNPVQLRRLQAGAACLWVVYGAIIGAAPVMVANLLVAAVAGWSSLRPGNLPASGP